MKDRIIKFLQSESLTATKFADEIGVQRSSISHILSGRNKPSYDFIYKILKRFPDINADWLITGTGNIYKTDEDLSNKVKIIEPELFGGIPEDKHVRRQEVTKNQMKSPELTEEKVHVDLENKEVERIVYFYSDGTFKEFKPGS